jgi:hypothetical protein
MGDGFEAWEGHNRPDARRLRRRAEIREGNATRPRCARCESDLIDCSSTAGVDEKAEELFGGEFVRGDLLCFWCWEELFSEPWEPSRFPSGHG